MAKNPLPSSKDHLDDEEYIDIEVSSYYYFSSSCPNYSSPQNKEFEFQIINYNKETTTSPADELFYRDKLLPLHQKILQKEHFEDLEDSFCINFLITPIGSPSQTCRVSFELNPNDHFFGLTTSNCIVKHNSPKKLWSKLIKHSLIIQKFKASRAFLKSLFSKSSCTKSNICSSKDMKISKKKTTNGTLSCAINKNEGLSFSSINSSTNSGSFSSSSSSSSSNSSFNSNYGFSSEIIECSIEAAVAHCKKSQECGWA